MYILCKHSESHFTKSNSLFVQTYLANKTWFWLFGEEGESKIMLYQISAWQKFSTLNLNLNT